MGIRLLASSCIARALHVSLMMHYQYSWLLPFWVTHTLKPLLLACFTTCWLISYWHLSAFFPSQTCAPNQQSPTARLIHWFA
mmetsp:Transcript_12319/g.37759  ORF Transcript_12319/g.37759 Transcript_12319/m.37759 type:complete len:82 (+) Transcript_12319:96-341(+)